MEFQNVTAFITGQAFECHPMHLAITNDIRRHPDRIFATFRENPS